MDVIQSRTIAEVERRICAERGSILRGYREAARLIRAANGWAEARAALDVAIADAFAGFRRETSCGAHVHYDGVIRGARAARRILEWCL